MREKNHPSILLKTIFVQTWGLLTVLCLFAACGDGGKARYDLEPLSEAKAVELLEKSSDNPEKTRDLLARVETNRTEDFDFQKFWQGLSERGLADNYSEEELQKLLKLHEQSCAEKDFDAFAGLVDELGDHFEYIFGELRKCETALSPERTLALIVKLMGQYRLNEEAQSRAAQFAQNAQEAAQREAKIGRMGPPHAQVLRMQEVKNLQVQAQNAQDAAQVAQSNLSAIPSNQAALSQALVLEILRDPHPGWSLVVCYLEPVDLDFLVNELRELGEPKELGEHFSERFSGCGI